MQELEQPGRRRFLQAGVAALAGSVAAGCRHLPMEQAFVVERGLRYGDAPEQTVDVWQPRLRWRSHAPAALVIHGGSWQEGKPRHMEEAVVRPLVDHGLVVANIDYRKAPQTRAPGAVEDARSAARWLMENAARFRIAPQQLIYCGASSGGHLALMAGLAPEQAGFGAAPRPCAVFNLWGVSDLAALETHAEATEIVRQFLPDAGADAMAHRCSPLTYVRAGLPPVMSIHAVHDELVPFAQSVQLNRALLETGNASRLVALERGSHQIVDWARVHTNLAKFLDTALNGAG